MTQAMDGKRAANGNGPVRRLTYGLLAVMVLVQPGCMCGCSLPGAARTVSATGSTVSASDGACCPHCTPTAEKSRPNPIAP